MTDVVAEARELLGKATPGPWDWHTFSIDEDRDVCVVTAKVPIHKTSSAIACIGTVSVSPDAALIAATPDLIDRLCAEVERLREALTKIDKLLTTPHAAGAITDAKWLCRTALPPESSDA